MEATWAPPSLGGRRSTRLLLPPYASCGVELWTTPLCPPLLQPGLLARLEAGLRWRAPLPGARLNPGGVSSGPWTPLAPGVPPAT